MEKENKNKVEVTERNLQQFIYEPGTKVEIDGELLQHLIFLANKIVEDQTETYFIDKFKFINTKTNKPVKTYKEEDLASGKVAKIVDVEKTLGSEPKFYRTPLALEFINVNLILNNIHMDAAKSGIAKHITDFEQPQEEELVAEEV